MKNEPSRKAEPVAWINRKGKNGEHGYLEWDKDDESEINIPLYTQEVVEEARKLGMQQERALWNLAKSSQEIMDTHPVKELKNIVLASATCSCGKVMEVTNLQPVKELTDEEILIVWTSSNFVGYTETGHIDEIFFNKFARAILRKVCEK